MSTTATGNEFRNLVDSHLSAAGFQTCIEVRSGHKKVDVSARWMRDELDGVLEYAIEAKDYAGTLPLSECTKFIHDYGTLVRNRDIDKAWLISRGLISPDGRKAIEAELGLKCFTLQEFQRALLRLDSYLRSLVALAADISAYYIRAHTEENEDLQLSIQSWLGEESPPPLAVISGYGKGKSTFAKHISSEMAQTALKDPTTRVPILIPLGEILDEIAIDSLLGRIFSSQHRATNYHFHLFDALNRAGRFLIIFDGFDEMKHGMTVTTFSNAFTELMKLDHHDARILILGRDTAFHNEAEFRSIIAGRQKTTLGREIATGGRRACRTTTLREFNSDEVRTYVKQYFPVLVRARISGGDIDINWINARVDELLSDQFAELIVRPVHAQMLCEIAVDPDCEIGELTRFGLYDAFVQYLLEREVKKRGRDPVFSTESRRRFNSSVAWWLWEQAGASTASLEMLPIGLCSAIGRDENHDYDDVALKRELTAGLLVEKNNQTIYFSHRSIQEFLVAEHLIRTGLCISERSLGDPGPVIRLLNPEIISFIVAYFEDDGYRSSETLDLMSTIDGIRGFCEAGDLSIYYRLSKVCGFDQNDYLRSIWTFSLAYFIEIGQLDFESFGQIEAHATLRHIKLGLASLSLQMTALSLAVGALAPNPHMFVELLPSLFASWIPVKSLGLAVDRLLVNRVNVTRVDRDSDPLLWAFIRSVSVTHAADSLWLELNIQALHDVCRDTLMAGVDIHRPQASTPILSCSVQSLYRAMADQGITENQLEKIRPFFNDERVRSRLRTIVVERRSPVRARG